MFHDLFYDMSSILACQKYTYTYFFPLSLLFGIFDCYSVISVQERRYYDLSFLVLCCCLIIFFLPRNYLLFSKHLLKCTILSEPFLSLSLSFHCGHTKTFWSLSLHWSLSLQNCLLYMWNAYYSNMKILLLNPYRSFIFLLLRKGICLIEHDMLIEYSEAEETYY